MVGKQSASYNEFREVPLIEPSEVVTREGWVKWGNDNLYPQFLWKLYYESPIHGGVVNSKVTYITSGGLKYSGTENWDEINKNGRSKYTLDELVEQFAIDQEVSASYYILCKYDALNEIWSLEHIPFELIRVNEAENIFYYSENWATSRQNDKTKFKTYTSFFNRTSETTECLLCVKDKSRQYTLEHNKLTSGYYPIPSYSGGIDAILTDIEINFFRLSEVFNGYKGGTILSLNNGVPSSQEEQDQIVDSLKLSATDKRKQGGIGVTFSDGKDREPSIVQLNGNDLDKRYIATESGLMQKIMISHSVINPKLFSVMQQSTVFDADLVSDFALFNATYAKRRQKNIADSLTYVLTQLNGITGEIEFNEYKLSLEQQIDETNQVSKALNSMSPLVANKVLSSLTSNEIRNLAKLSPIEGGDTIPTSSTTFSADKSTDEVLEHFKNCGSSKEGITILHSDEFKFNSDDEILDTFFKDSFANVTETQGRIITMLQNGESYDAIVKALDLKPIEVTQQILKLQNLGYLEGGKPTSRGLKETATRETISVVYSYEKRPDVDGDSILPDGRTRPFCETLVRMDKVYTRSEIDSISNAIGRDVWYYRGGWYHNPDTNKNTPSCRHYWKQNVIIK
jgi:hypothetical protein